MTAYAIRRLALVAAIGASGCVGDVPEEATPVIREDETAVEPITSETREGTTELPTESRTEPPLALFGWHVESVPTLSIGNGLDLPLHQVAGAAVLRDGIIAIADGALRVVFVDHEGNYLTTVGREGDGPGEFRAIEWLQPVTRDSVVVFDPRLQRASYFSSDGDLLRVVTPEGPPGERSVPQLLGVFEDGTLLSGQRMVPSDVPTGESYLLRPNLRLARHDQAGAFLGVVGTVPGHEMGMLQGIAIMAPPFARRTFIVVSADKFYVAPAEDFRVTVFDHSGSRRREMGKDHQPIRIPQDDVPRMRDGTPVPAPATFPAISKVLLDDMSNVWIGPFLRDSRETAIWTVFDPNGDMLGEVTMPEGLTPLHIGADFVLGVWRDSLDVEQVRLHVLKREP